MQAALLPKKTEFHESIRLDWLLIPSLYLAGDMLNYFLVDGNKLVFYHLDVAGHGIPAALLSVTLNRLLMPIPGSPIAKTVRPVFRRRLIPRRMWFRNSTTDFRAQTTRTLPWSTACSTPTLEW